MLAVALYALVKNWWFRRGGRETEEEVGKIIRKRKLEGIRNWVNGLADDDSAVDEVFDVYCKDVDRVRERRKWLDN